MINRSMTTKAEQLNIVGGSTFGRYPKISVEKTVNMFISDNFLVPYSGYITAIVASLLGNGREGRGIHTSVKLNRLIVVINEYVFSILINFNQQQQKVEGYQINQIGTLQTSSGVVYISENDKPQIAISDGNAIYIYDQTATPRFQTITTNFVPGYLDFHDTYFLCAATADGYTGSNNTWRLSASNNGASWPDDAAHIGLLQTKPDNTQAVIRFPGKGNMVAVFGKTVGEPWFDVGYQLFPYQRNQSMNFDYGCLNPATIARMDEYVAWLAINEASGPVIMFSNGGPPQAITTDGIDYFFSNLQNPEDSQAFFYRQDGHVFYHINFYSDNVSLFYDFHPQSRRFFHASDENGNYFIASQVAFFNNQYYFISRNNGNLYALDTIFTTYDQKEIPRDRYCRPIRNEKQEAFIVNDLGFTIETGETDYLDIQTNDVYLITEDGKKYITEGEVIFFITEDGNFLTSEDGQYLIDESQSDEFFYLIRETPDVTHAVPHVDLNISIDGGEHFSSYDTYYLPPIGQRKNKLMWWQLGWCNDFVAHVRFHTLGRVVATDGVVNTRQ